MASHWSPADLNRQRVVVALIALRAERSRLHLEQERGRFVASLRSAIGSPLVIGSVFTAGFLLARRGDSRRRRRGGGIGVVFKRIRFAALRGMALMQLYSRVVSQFRAGWQATAPPPPAVDG